MGTERGYLESLLAYWSDTFDWRAQEPRFNAFEPTATEVDGQRIHFLHARSPEPDALPLLISHGWPGSVTEFLDVLGPLSNPRADGGDPTDAFHVVAPSLPGYGFSGPTHERGWHPRRMAEAFTQIMWDLGYNRYGAQGGDWGSIVSQNVADLDPEHVCGLHLNFITVPRPQDAPDPTPEEQQDREAVIAFRTSGAGYQEIQGTKPQTRRLLARRLTLRSVRMDRREVHRVDRLRRRRRTRVHERPVAHQHHRLLGDGNRDVVGSALLRDATGRALRDPVGIRGRAHRCRELPGRGHPNPAVRGPSTATTSPTGPSSPTAGTSRRCRCPTSSWPTSGSSSAPSGSARAVQRNNLRVGPTQGVVMADLDEAAKQFEATMGGFTDEADAAARASAEPQAMYVQRAAECPVLRNPNGTITLLRMEDILTVNRSHDVEQASKYLGSNRKAIPLGLDGAEHTKYRRLLDPVFTARRIAPLEQNIRKLANELIDGFVGDGEVDVNVQWCQPLPSTIFISILGLPLVDLYSFMRFKNMTLGIGVPKDATPEERMDLRNEAVEWLQAYFNDSLDAREASGDPGDDMIGWLMTTEVEGDRLTRENILDILGFLMIAGLDTVAASLACMLSYFARHPDERARVRRRPVAVARCGRGADAVRIAGHRRGSHRAERPRAPER